MTYPRLVAVVALWSVTVAAQPPETRAEARQRFDRGLRLFDQGDDEGALAEFQRAHSLIPNPRVLYNIGLVRASMHQPVEAVAALSELLEAPSGLSAELVTHARRVRDEQKQRIAQLTITTNVANVRIELEGRELGTTPLAKPIPLASGKHRLTLVASGYQPVRREIDLAGGEVRTLAVSLSELSVGRLGELSVKTNVPGATLLVDGIVVAKTPLVGPLSFAPGRHSVELRREGYRSVVRTIQLRDGDAISLRLPLERDEATAASGRLELEIREENAVILMDGVPSARHALSVPHGPHRLRVERSGFFPFEREVYVARGGTSRVRIELEPTAEFRADYRDGAKSRRFWSLVAMGGGAAVLGGGIGFLVWNKGERDDAQQAFDDEAPRYEVGRECWAGNPAPNASCRDLETLADDIDTANGRFGIGWALVAVGAAGLGAGTFFLLTGDDPDRYEPGPESDVFGRVRLVPAVSPGVATCGLRGSF